MSDWSGRELHFIGIGGAGMSGLAVVCAELGAAVGGSDRSESTYMERVRDAGVEPSIGHDAANLPEGAEVVVSTAIGDANPELALARERGQKVIHRGDLLAELCAEKRLIAIAGTHGKTTTTSMTVWALRGLGEDPAFFVGGEVPGLGPGGAPANAGWGESEWVVAEADESDGSFLRLAPEIAVITNVEMDHHSKWGSLEPLVEAFAGFAAKSRVTVLPAASRDAGAVEEVRAALAADPGGVRSSPRIPRESANTPGEGAEVVTFSLGAPGPGELELALPGAHNLLNARAALAALGRLGSISIAPRPRWPTSAGSGAGSRSRASGVGSAYMTTTRTTRPRSAPPFRPCANSNRPGSSPFSSPISTPAPRSSPPSSAPPSPSPTRSRSSTSTQPARNPSAPSPASAAST